MAKYTSQYPSLGFYVNGELQRFNNGVYVTDDKTAISLLDGLTDVKKVDEPKVEQTKQPEAKPATKAPAKRTASAK